MKKNIILLSITLFVSTAMLKCGDFVTIDDPIPSSYGTVTADPLIIDGTSSQPYTKVRLFFNGNPTSSAYTDAYGDWSSTSPYLSDGTYTLTAMLTASNRQTLATDTVSFTVCAPIITSISASSAQGSTVFLNPILLSGNATLSYAMVNISLDGNLIGSTTTDANGNWEYVYTLLAANGAHTFFVELLDENYNTVANTTVNIISNIPLILPSGISQAWFVNGDVPTSGSGSGPGYSYTVSGSSITINFTPAFSAPPSMTTTGLRSAGSSTVSLVSVSATAATIAFSSGTQVVHFSAATLQ